MHFCPLCGGNSTLFFIQKNREYSTCENCSGVFLNEAAYLNPEKEKARYLEHNNDVNDTGYQSFVRPIVDAVFSDFEKRHAGLDFGAGTGPVIAKMLKDAGYNIKLYDPYFHNYPELLHEQYDYIVCCEVMEHFYKPLAEFKKLKSLLRPGGVLYCMTYLIDEKIDFKTWQYKNDPTHVFIYHANTIDWIRKQVGFEDVSINNRLIVFKA